MGRNEERLYYVNLNFYFFKDIVKIYVSQPNPKLVRIQLSNHLALQTLFSLAYSQGPNYDCRDKLYETKIDGCKFTAALIKSALVKVFFKNLLETVNFPIECPFRVGKYSVTNFTLNIPEKMPLPRSINICMTQKYFVKTTGAKKFVPLVVLKGNLGYNA